MTSDAAPLATTVGEWRDRAPRVLHFPIPFWNKTGGRYLSLISSILSARRTQLALAGARREGRPILLLKFVVGKRVPGTWSGVLDVFVFCVDVRSSRHTDPGRAPGGDTIYRDTLPRDGPATPGAPWRRQWRSGSEAARPLENSKETQR